MKTELELNRVEQSLVDALEQSSEVSVLALVEPVTAQKVLKAIYLKQRREMPVFAIFAESLISAAAAELDSDNLRAILRKEEA